MITKTIYKCETCGAVYDTAREARTCEDSHIFAEYILQQKYPQNAKYPAELVVTMGNSHKILYKYDSPIIVEPSDVPYFTHITVSRDSSTNNIVLIAEGNALPPEDTYSWVITCDDIKYNATSNSPTLATSKSVTNAIDYATVVKVKVSTPNVNASQYIIKYGG